MSCLYILSARTDIIKSPKRGDDCDRTGKEANAFNTSCSWSGPLAINSAGNLSGRVTISPSFSPVLIVHPCASNKPIRESFSSSLSGLKSTRSYTCTPTTRSKRPMSLLRLNTSFVVSTPSGLLTDRKCLGFMSKIIQYYYVYYKVLVRSVSPTWNTFYPSLLRLAEKLEDLKIFEVEVREVIEMELQDNM